MKKKKDPFEKIMQLASQPLPSKAQKQVKPDSYTSKKTHQHSAVNASVKQRDESR